MKRLYLVAGNHMEDLAAALARWLANHAAGADKRQDPLETDTVMVQSLGMQHWLSMAIARHNGICANVAFPFPNALLDDLFHRMLGPVAGDRHFDALPLTFAVMKALPDLMETPPFVSLNNYLAKDGHALKTFQLSRKIADLLDQYLIFRHDLLLSWERSKASQANDPNGWQAILWQKLSAGFQSMHRAAMQRRIIQRLQDPHIDPDSLPSKLAVFGISHLPRFHLEVLEALSAHIPVYLFLMNPCRQYWGDIFSDRRMARTRRRTPGATRGELDAAAMHYEQGNRLLASWGNQGRQFFDFIQQLDVQSIDLFAENDTQTLLGRIQQDILDLVDQPLTREKASKQNANHAGDASIQFHIGHSPMREIEILHDQLLGILDRHEDIEPRDIMVMAPDISEYVPYIHAVFGGRPNDRPSLSYSVADQSLFLKNEAVRAFLQVLDLRDGRFEASQVLALLDFDCIRRRFDLSSPEVARAETWVRMANIRWGWDREDRRRHQLPTFEENSWRWGLDRLLLGFAMKEEEGRLFEKYLPFEAIEGVESQTLGNLVLYVQTLRHSLTTLVGQATMEGWRRILTAIVEELFAADETSLVKMQSLRDAIHQMADAAKTCAYDKEVPYEVIRYQLGDTFDRRSQGVGFIAGGVTFCSLLPMRSIPATVVCLLGLQHNAFPREASEPGFNLIALEPRPGDRSRRDDDKYLFLEALLSARRYFYISHVGRSRQDNAEIPPSVVVDELKDYIRENFGVDSHELTTIHPLHGFSPLYFQGEGKGLFSYSQQNREAGLALQSTRKARPFFSQPLRPPPEAWRQCELGQLIAFFGHPSRFLLQERLNLVLAPTAVPEEDREPFELNPLDRFLISQRWLEGMTNHDSQCPSYDSLIARGNLPSGNTGKVIYREVGQDVSLFAQRLRSRLPSGRPHVHSVDINVGLFRISAEIDQVYPDGRVVYRIAKCRAQDLLSVFLHHLLLNLSMNHETVRESRLICSDQQWHFGRVAQARPIVSTYLDLYWQGLRQPLPFFPRAGWAYALVRSKGGTREAALSSARRQWEGDGFVEGWRGESADIYNQRCFGHEDPLNELFEELATTIFKPLLAVGEQEPE